MTELSSCGLDMTDFREGDIPIEYRSVIINDINAFEGTWEEIKKASESSDVILSKAGVGFIKRKAITASTLKTEIKVKSIDDKGNPTMHYTTYYPLGITKQTSFPTNGTMIDQPDNDTCNWKTLAVFCNGRLIQKRSGSKGIMYDTRCIMKKHPTTSMDHSPIMCFVLTLIDTEGKKHSVTQFWKKIK